MLFRWLFDELGNALRFVAYRMLTAIAALLGVWLIMGLVFLRRGIERIPVGTPAYSR